MNGVESSDCRNTSAQTNFRDCIPMPVLHGHGNFDLGKISKIVLAEPQGNIDPSEAIALKPEAERLIKLLEPIARLAT